MRIVITCKVPHEWRDVTEASGILELPFEDIVNVLQMLGAEDVNIRAGGDE
jgi:hypothetical protein